MLKTERFVFEIWEMIKKIKTDVHRRVLVCQIKKSSILANFIEKIIFMIKTKSSLSSFVLVLSTISHILKTKFCVFCT